MNIEVTTFTSSSTSRVSHSNLSQASHVTFTKPGKYNLIKSSKNMKPIFVGNVEYDSRQSDIERLFKRYGKVDRVDMKTGFAFVYMDDERDAEDAIRKLDRIEFGRKRRPLRVEWTKQERDNKRMGDSKKPAANTKLSKTLFVINFDPVHTRTRDLEKHFDAHGKIVNIRIRKNFAFIQFETQEDATRALEATHMSMLIDRDITVEYALRDDDERRPGNSPDRRGRDISPAGRSNDRRRSPSPYRRDRGSPDYGRGSNPVSRHERRASPRYDRPESPINGRGSSPVSRYERRTSPKYVRADSPNNARGSSPVSRYERRASPVNGRYRSASPPPRGRSRS